MIRSSGVVTLRFRGSPITIRTLQPSASTNAASSVAFIPLVLPRVWARSRSSRSNTCGV